MRVRRILERSQSPCETLSEGDVTLHIVRSQLQYGTQTLDLSGNELRILYYLWIHYPHLVSRDELIEYLWEDVYKRQDNPLPIRRRSPWPSLPEKYWQSPRIPTLPRILRPLSEYPQSGAESLR